MGYIAKNVFAVDLLRRLLQDTPCHGVHLMKNRLLGEQMKPRRCLSLACDVRRVVFQLSKAAVPMLVRHHACIKRSAPGSFHKVEQLIGTPEMKNSGKTTTLAPFAAASAMTA